MASLRAARLLAIGFVVMAFGARAEGLLPAVGPVLLTITGAVQATNGPGEARLDRAMLESLGRTTIRTSTPWTDGVKVFEGVSLRAVLDRVGAKGRRLRATALNDYEVTIPLDDLAYEPIIAMRMDGNVLLARNKGPLWIVYPRDRHAVLQDERVDNRWIWQLTRLHVE
jgi:hypothetical protein